MILRHRVGGALALMVACVGGMAGCGTTSARSVVPITTTTVEWGWERAIPAKPWYYRLEVAGDMGDVQLQSVSFVSRAKGYALVSAPCTTSAKAACPSEVVFSTTNGGERWRPAGALAAGWQDSFIYRSPGPPIWFNTGRDVTSLVFVNNKDGWAYGFGLWATHDGGRTWSNITFGAPHTSSFAYSVQDGNGRPVALFGLHCAAWMCHQAAVYSTTPGADNWRQLPGARVSGAQAGVNGMLAVYGRTGWLLTQQPSEFLTGPDNGKGEWRRLPTPRTSCGSAVEGFAALSALDLVALCESGSQVSPMAGPQYIKSVKSFYLSTDGGYSWHLAGHLPYLGGATAVISGNPGQVLAALYSGPVYSSSDLGRTWVTDLRSPDAQMLGGITFSQVALDSAGFGYAVPAIMSGLQDVFYITSDEAAKWHQVRVVRRDWQIK